MFAVRDEQKEPSKTAQEPGRLLSKGFDRPFIERMTLTTLLQTHIPLCYLLFSTPNSSYVLVELGAASHGQTSVDKLLCTIAGVGCRTHETLTNRRQGAADSSELRRLTAGVWSLHDCLD